MTARILGPLIALLFLIALAVAAAWLAGFVGRAIIEAFLHGWALLP